jgi:hypothetical protein
VVSFLQVDERNVSDLLHVPRGEYDWRLQVATCDDDAIFDRDRVHECDEMHTTTRVHERLLLLNGCGMFGVSPTANLGIPTDITNQS